MEMQTPVSCKNKEANQQQKPPSSPSPSPSPLRQWRPAAQKNLRNQWSKLSSSNNRWFSAASQARSHATTLVNVYLSQRYLRDMDLGALMDMPSIRQHSEEKLAKRQEIYRSKLLSSYRDMASSVAHMVQSSRSLRCFLKVSSVSSLVQFCDHPEDASDPGDGGGVPVFSFLSIANFENLAQELVEMFLLELNLKRLLVVELLSSIYKEGDERANLLGWCYELYPGEFDDLRLINMFSSENNEPLPPRIKDWQPGDPLSHQSKCPRNHEVLQVYLTAWLADVNIDMNRMREIFSIVEDEIQVKLS